MPPVTAKDVARRVREKMEENGGDAGKASSSVAEEIASSTKDLRTFWRRLGPRVVRELFKLGAQSDGERPRLKGPSPSDQNDSRFQGVEDGDVSPFDLAVPVESSGTWKRFGDFDREDLEKNRLWYDMRAKAMRRKAEFWSDVASRLEGGDTVESVLSEDDALVERFLELYGDDAVIEEAA